MHGDTTIISSPVKCQPTTRKPAGLNSRSQYLKKKKKIQASKCDLLPKAPGALFFANDLCCWHCGGLELEGP